MIIVDCCATLGRLRCNTYNLLLMRRNVVNVLEEVDCSCLNSSKFNET